MGFPSGPVDKEFASPWRRHRRYSFDPWLRKILWRRKWHPTPVCLPGKFHGQRSLEGYSPRGLKELVMTERLTLTNWLHRGCITAGRLYHWPLVPELSLQPSLPSPEVQGWAQSSHSWSPSCGRSKSQHINITKGSFAARKPQGFRRSMLGTR